MYTLGTKGKQKVKGLGKGSERGISWIFTFIAEGLALHV